MAAMAKGKKTGGKNFEKGHHIGRPASPPDIKVAAGMTKATFLSKLKQFMDMNIAELETVLRDKNMTVADHWVGRIALMGIKNGDERRLNFMADRLFGKVTDKIDVKMVKPTIVQFDDGTAIEMSMKPTNEEET